MTASKGERGVGGQASCMRLSSISRSMGLAFSQELWLEALLSVTPLSAYAPTHMSGSDETSAHVVPVCSNTDLLHDIEDSGCPSIKRPAGIRRAANKQPFLLSFHENHSSC
jgi:hypothetical protein